MKQSNTTQMINIQRKHLNNSSYLCSEVHNPGASGSARLGAKSRGGRLLPDAVAPTRRPTRMWI